MIFTISQLDEARENTKNLCSEFTFISEFEPHEIKVNTINAYLISKTVQNLIISENNKTSYKLRDNVYTKEFIDIFFPLKDMYEIDKNSFQYFQAIYDELQIPHLALPLKNAAISMIYQTISSNELSDVEPQIEFICKHYNDIDFMKIQSMMIPKAIFDELLPKFEFIDEDDHTQFFIKNFFFFGEKYLESINFDILSNDVIYQLLDIDFESFVLIEKIKKRCKNELKTIIKLLYITTDQGKPRINLDFIDKLNVDENNKLYTIQYKTIQEADFPSFVQLDKKYLNDYDVIVIGGCDSFSVYVKKIGKQHSVYFNNFHNENGVLIFLHDVVYSNLEPVLLPLANLMDYKGFNARNVFEKLKTDFNSRNKEIFSMPFEIDNNFIVAPTHQTPEYNSKYSILYDSDKNNHYYSENLDENIADCQMGHTNTITESEQKFFYNVVCHLYKWHLKHNVKTKL